MLEVESTGQQGRTANRSGQNFEAEKYRKLQVVYLLPNIAQSQEKTVCYRRGHCHAAWDDVASYGLTLYLLTFTYLFRTVHVLRPIRAASFVPLCSFSLVTFGLWARGYVNKDWTHTDMDKNQAFKDKDKDWTHKDKDQDFKDNDKDWTHMNMYQNQAFKDKDKDWTHKDKGKEKDQAFMDSDKY